MSEISTQDHSVAPEQLRAYFNWLGHRVTQVVAIAGGRLRTANLRELDELLAFCNEHNGRADVYACINGISDILAGTTTRASTKEITDPKVLLLDVDPASEKVPGGRAHLAAIAMLPLVKETDMEPLLVDSGRGAQILLRCKEGLKPTWGIFQSKFCDLLTRYECRLDPTHDATRLARVPGTVNLKSKRTARLIPVPSELPRNLTETFSGRRTDLNDQSRSGYEMAAANALVKFGFSQAEIESLLAAYPHGRGLAGHPTSRRITAGKAVGPQPQAGEMTGGVEPIPATLLHHTIDCIRRRGEHSFLKKRSIAEAVLGEFSQGGRFYRTRDGRPYYFQNTERRLYRIGSDEFVRQFSEVTKLNPTEIEFKYVLEEITTHVLRHATLVQVFQLGHFDRTRRRLYVSNFSGGVFVLTETGISEQPNGIDGVLFETFPDADPVHYVVPSDRTTSLEEFLIDISFDPERGLPPEAYRWLLRIWLYSVFIPEFHKTRVIPLFVGPQGSGKTTSVRRIGMLLLGRDFDVAHLESRDRGEQAFLAAICGKPFVAFDNADANIRWLSDHLARYATGSKITLRQLYTTNQLASYSSVASLALTARDPQFRRPDVAERLLIFPLKRLEQFIPESVIAEHIVQARNALFSELLEGLQRILPCLLETKPSATSFRMADFAAFGSRVMSTEGREDEFVSWLAKMEAVQASYATEDEPLVEILSGWLARPGNRGKQIQTGKLFSELKDIAADRHLPMVETASALGKRLRTLQPVLQEALGAKVTSSRVGNTTRWIFGGPEPRKFPEFDSPDSSDSPEQHAPGSAPGGEEVAQMSEMSEIDENSSVEETPDGKSKCLLCGGIFGTWAGWRAHIVQRRCPERER